MDQQKVEVKLFEIKEFFAAEGMSVRLLFHRADVVRMMSDIGKQAVHPISEIADGELMEGQAFWLALEQDGVAVACISARYVDLSGAEFGEYWSRFCFSKYPGDLSPVVGVSRDLRTTLRGRLVYFGGVQVSESAQGSLPRLRRLVECAKLHSVLRWDFDWIYTIINKEHGPLARVYKFEATFPAAVNWRAPVPVGLADDQLYLVQSLGDLLSKLGA